TRREVSREHAESGPDLEDDVLRPQFGEAADHAEDVLVDEEVLTKLLLRRDAHKPNAAVALASILVPSSEASSPRAAASAVTVCTTYAGSFGLPRTGCGARYGLSVSARMRSPGTRAAASRSSGAFGYVTFPANDTYHPRSSAGASSDGEEKQCRITVPSKSRSAAIVSWSAARVWMTRGLPVSCASWSGSWKSWRWASRGA